MPSQVLVLNHLNNALLITLRMWLLIWQGNGSHESDLTRDVTTPLRKLASGEEKLPFREMGWFSKGIVKCGKHHTLQYNSVACLVDMCGD